jgi:hypothetical protein
MARRLPMTPPMGLHGRLVMARCWVRLTGCHVVYDFRSSRCRGGRAGRTAYSRLSCGAGARVKPCAAGGDCEYRRGVEYHMDWRRARTMSSRLTAARVMRRLMMWCCVPRARNAIGTASSPNQGRSRQIWWRGGWPMRILPHAHPNHSTVMRGICAVCPIIRWRMPWRHLPRLRWMPSARHVTIVRKPPVHGM